MADLQALLKELRAYQIEFSVGDSEFNLTGLFIVGFLLVVIAAYIRGRSLDHLKSWQTANKPVAPHGSPTPPISVAVQGCNGCLFSLIGRTIFWLLVAVGLDLMVTGGRILSSVLHAATG